jgi:agmatine deiminase
MRMPAEWEPHERTWVAFPHHGYTLGESKTEQETARQTWARVANEASDFEHVTVVAHPDDVAIARSYLSSQIEIVDIKIDDAWIRDSGPTFVFDGDQLMVVDWVFNGWGAQDWAKYNEDAKLAGEIARLVGVPVLRSELVNEGGGIHVNGAGAVLLTETVQLGKERNPGWSKDKVETEIHKRLGTDQAIWIKRGLTRDYEEFGTKGHIDIVACFAPDGRVLYHSQENPSHPDYEISLEVRETLAPHFELVAIPAPDVLKDSEEYVDYSYINHYVLNDAVLLCSFDDAKDKEVRAQLKDIYPGREIRLLPSTELFARGGGIHCITQQQPKEKK